MMEALELVTAKKLLHERQVVEGMPDPISLLQAAEQEEPKPIYLCASDYGEIINVLRNKGFTWSEIQLWLGSKGANFSQQAVTSGWRTWERSQTAKSHISPRLYEQTTQPL